MKKVQLGIEREDEEEVEFNKVQGFQRVKAKAEATKTELKMWHTTHEMSATQVHQHPGINAYQHYSTAQIPHHHANHHMNGNMGKWNIAGQRSSYSLPHPGHTQSNMRWGKYDEKAHLKATQTQPARNLSNSTRNLAAIPSNAPYMHEQRQIFGPGVGMPRQRPASMYDSPNSMPNINYHNHHLNGFIPLPSKKDVSKQHGKHANIGLRQSPGELVRLSHIYFVFFIARQNIWMHSSNARTLCSFNFR